MGRKRRIVAATLAITALAMGGRAAAAASSATDAPPEPVIVSSNDVQRARPVPGTPAAPPAPTAPTPAAPAGVMTQTIGVTVLPGPLLLREPPSEVALHRDGERYVGTIGPVRLVDARGSYGGWRLAVDVGVPGGQARVTRVEGLALSVDGITASGGVVQAAPGSGGGSWDVWIDVEVDAGTGDGVIAPLGWTLT